MTEHSLRGYIVSGKWPEDGAVLVFAQTGREAKRMGWRVIVDDYMDCEYQEVRVRLAKNADPERWGVTAPCILEPDGCERCERWYADAPVNKQTGLCTACTAGDQTWEER